MVAFGGFLNTLARLASIAIIELLMVTAADARSSADYWKETSLTFKDLKALVNDLQCYANADQFNGCIQALNGLLKHRIPAQALVSARSPLRETVDRVLARYGSTERVTLKEDPARPADAKAAFIKEQRDRKARLLEWRTLFAQTRASNEAIPFQEILATLQKEIMAQFADREAEIAASAYNLYLSAVYDPHTVIFPKAQFLDLKNQGDAQNHFGIGATLERGADDQVHVQELSEGSPAQSAGIGSQDVITHINGESVSGKSKTEIKTLLLGPADSAIQLTVQRGKKVQAVSVVRGPNQTKTVSSRLLSNGVYGWGIIRLTSFLEPASCKKIREHIEALQNAGVSGLILDLRDNLGGLVQEAVCISNLFLEANQVVVELRQLDGLSPSVVGKTTEDAITQLPLIVLINASSASASEIVAGALQDYARAVVIGSRSYGKGTVQYIREHPTIPGVHYSKTAARFYLPSGRTNQIVGILPDIEAFPQPMETDAERFAHREEDLFVNALPPESPVWKQTREPYIQALNACRQHSGKAFRAWNRDPNQDYTLGVAQDVLSCMRRLDAESRGERFPF